MKTNDIVLKSHSPDTVNEITPYVADGTDEDVFH